MSSTGYIMTLANSVIGVGILAMPFCFQKCGILLSILLLIFSNLITRLACYYLLVSSHKARRKNFEFLASYIFGASGKFLVELALIGYLMGSCVTYFVVVGDLGPQIIARLFHINHSDSLRTFIMIVVTIFCIIPLCLLKNISSLSMICISSIIFYFCLVLKIFFESESKMVSSYWYENAYFWRPSGITQCLPIFCMALSAQPQIFQIYESLPNQTIDKMSHIIKHGINMATIVYISVGVFGYFISGNVSGNVLLSLSPSLASDIIQMGFVISVAVSFPLVIFPCRASLYSLLYHRSHSETAHYIPEHRFKYITISMVLAALIIGILIPSIELIIGLVGSTIGVAICIIFPSLCFIRINKKNSTEKLAAQFLLVFGFSIMILGTYANLGAIDEQQTGVPAVVPIGRLPDIHVETPTQNIFAAPESVEKKIEMGPNKPFDTNYEAVGKLKGSKRKVSKPSPPVVPIVREINLSEQQKNEMSMLKPSMAKPIIVPNQLSEPTTKKVLDSVLNNEAIRKEDQEIAIEENEKQQKDDERTKEILAQVQNVLDKHDAKNQKLVLDRINEISEKVDKLQVHKSDKVALNANEAQQDTNASEKIIKPIDPYPTSFSNEPLKNVGLPPIPVVKLLAERNSNGTPSQANLSESLNKVTSKLVESKIEKPNEINAKKASVDTLIDSLKETNDSPPKLEKSKENNVGRDLLSDTNDFQTVHSTNVLASNDGNKT